jgi:hypothetical protein
LTADDFRRLAINEAMHPSAKRGAIAANVRE